MGFFTPDGHTSSNRPRPTAFNFVETSSHCDIRRERRKGKNLKVKDYVTLPFHWLYIFTGNTSA